MTASVHVYQTCTQYSCLPLKIPPGNKWITWLCEWRGRQKWTYMLSSETGFITQPWWQWCTLGPHSELVQELCKQCWHSGNSRTYMYTEHCNWLKSEIVLIDHSLACILKKTLIKTLQKKRLPVHLKTLTHTHWSRLSITVSCVKCIQLKSTYWHELTSHVYTVLHLLI